MKRILSNIGVIISSLLVLLLSIGVSVSKMNCSMDNKIFLGTEVPNCMESQDKLAALQIKSTSCCKKTESITTCCPQTNDNSCSSDTQSVQFDFETLTYVPIDRNLIDPSLMSSEELAWLNAYHAETLRRLSPHVSVECARWLKGACAQL